MFCFVDSPAVNLKGADPDSAQVESAEHRATCRRARGASQIGAIKEDCKAIHCGKSTVPREHLAAASGRSRRRECAAAAADDAIERISAAVAQHADHCIVKDVCVGKRYGVVE